MPKTSLPDDQTSSNQPRLELLTRELASLGVESPSQRTARRVVPWIASFALHGLMILLGFILTWTAVMLSPDQEPTVIIADFDALTYEPLMMLELRDAELQEDLVQDRVEMESLEESIDEQFAEIEFDPINLISDAASQISLSNFAPEPTSGRAEFVGLSSSNARRIVYVIDASGSMIRSLPIVVQELGRSLSGLTNRQSFSVIFFQRNEALVVPPPNRLTVATSDEKIRVLEWIDRNIIARGTSNPLRALEKALDFKPDVIFLLSENITGGGQWEIDQRDLLEFLEDRNPVESRSGRRRTTINCIQFLDPDPLDTLKKIADIHGGPRGYKFLDRKELGLSTSR